MKACPFFFLVLFSTLCFAQPLGLKLYGFRQEVLKGVPPTYETDEKGNKLPPKIEPHYNLFIYLAYPTNAIPELVEIWVGEDQFSVRQEAVKIPVEIIYDNGPLTPEKVILVPQTTDTVMQLVLTGKLPAKTTAVKKSLAETNELVLIYKLNGKIYSQTLKKIKSLRKALMQ